MITLDHTHDVAARSWLELTAGAGHSEDDFPIQNLPFGVFSQAGSAPRIGVAIADQVFDLTALHATKIIAKTSVAKTADAEKALQACVAAQGAGSSATSLNALMALGPGPRRALRHALFALLHTDAPADWQRAVRACLVPQSQVRMHLPAQVGDYTDFYTSIYHATNVGKLFRPDNPLLPNYRWVPIGYHGRASSLQVSGVEVRRPQGQLMAAGADKPELKPSARLDYELELGLWVGHGNALGDAVPLDQGLDHVFGVSLLNDWSARDVQAWEYQPLGPFLSKNFATSVSPWVVTLDALAPFFVPMQRPAEDAQREDLPYLHSEANRAHGALDIRLEVGLRTAAMRRAGAQPHWICHTSYRHAYWTVAQLVAHHTVNGCNLQAGDLLGTGTLSGPTPSEAGALLELTQGGKQALQLPGGETRTFLLDGDEVVFRGHCVASGYARIGLGVCAACILPASGRAGGEPPG